MITAIEAVRLLEQVAEDKGPETRYQAPGPSGCVYVHKGAPSCIVGHALHRSGIKIDVIASLDDRTNDGGSIPIGTNAEEIPNYLPDSFTRTAASIMGFVQREQDSAVAWGLAIRNGVIAWNAIGIQADMDEVDQVRAWMREKGYLDGE